MPSNGPAGASPQSSRFKPIDPLRVLRKYAWLLIAALVLGIGLGVGAYLVLKRYTPAYTSQASFRVHQAAADVWATNDSGVASLGSDRLAIAIRTEIAQLTSEDVLTSALQREEAQRTNFVKRIRRQAERNPDSDPYLTIARKKLQSALSAYHKSGTALMAVEMTTGNSEDASRLLDAIIAVYQRRLDREYRNRTDNLRTVFLQEQEAAREEINRLQGRVSEFRSEENLATLQQAQSEANVAYQQAATRKTKLETALNEAQSAYQSLKQSQQSGNFNPSPDEIAGVASMRPVQMRKERLSSLRERKRVMLNRFGEEHRSIQRIEDEIAAVEAEKQRLMRELLRERQAAQLEQAASRIEGIKAQLAETRDRLNDASGRLTDLGNRLSEYQALQDQLTAAKDRRQRATDSLNNLRIGRKRQDTTPVRLSTPPSSPRLTSPDMKVTVGGTTVLLLGLVAGLAFLKEVTDQRMLSPSDVSLVPDAELLGQVPDTDEDPSGRRPIERLVEKHPSGLIAECFRQVRTAVLTKMDRRGYKTVVMVGAQPEGGTSSVAQNLAASLSHNGRRVLLVDCNFRRPKQHELAGLGNERGLVEVLRDQASADEVITPLEGTRLSVLPTGVAHEAEPELLESQALRNLLSRLENDYDFILIDAPPALLTSEARMLAKHVDALISVVRAGRDKRGMVERMLRQLDGHRADVLGVLLNGVRSSAGGYFRKSYAAFHKYQSNGQGVAGNGRPTQPAAERTQSTASTN